MGEAKRRKAAGQTVTYERVVVRMAPTPELAIDPRWAALTKALACDALWTALGAAEPPLTSLLCDQPYDPGRVPAVAVAVEHMAEGCPGHVVGICNFCAGLPGLESRVIARVEVLLEANPAETQRVGPVGHA